METPYQPHQQRVLDEKAELDIKIAALGKFIESVTFGGLKEPERLRMFAQHRVMVEYSSILRDRIAAF
jgi:hypothetical protein